MSYFPSTVNPRDEATPSDAKRKPGKQPGAKGVWRSQALIPERTEDHYPFHCERCGQGLELWFVHEGSSAHMVLDLERQAAGVRVACVKHRYFAVACPCGAKTAARPRTASLHTTPTVTATAASVRRHGPLRHPPCRLRARHPSLSRVPCPRIR